MNDTLKLNRLFYTRDVLQEAKQAYKGLADIEIKEIEEYFFCRFLKCKYDLSETMLEFENYLMEVLNCRSRGNDMD